MFFWKALVPTISTTSLVAAAILGSSHIGIKRSEGTVTGAEDGTSYHFNSTGTSAQCAGLSVADLESSLARFDSLFPPQYSAGPFYEGQTVWSSGALYLDTASGVKGFYISYSTVTPNTTATWVDAGADILNVWLAVREDIVEEWSQGSTFQWAWYSIDKTIDGVSNHAGEFTIQIQTPTFVKLCDTSCGGTCNPNICTC
ncbi:hypothetical protein J7T55_007652 [Diaporthe amygdali]|uniref:uncharacterized protein n=1 Tax=Phomopsis amygdali TaxID=1214568 RepID=UPI0022FED444|nr:uncharacterized protein J7T55_007652 [Diaporthe amygdali]KAJ0107463.1 hypothetical protein J7T55_007652 [Diaporthe amygdali]